MPSRKRKRSAEASPPANNDPASLASSSSHQQPPAFQSKSSRSKTPRTEAMVPPDHHLAKSDDSPDIALESVVVERDEAKSYTEYALTDEDEEAEVMNQLFAISAPTITAEDDLRVLPQDATTDSGMRLLTDIVARGDAADHFEEWFRHLGMPCQPCRIFKQSTSNSLKIPGHSNAHYTASSVTQDIMEEYHGWKFVSYRIDTDREMKDLEWPYTEEWQVSECKAALYNITIQPTKAYDPDSGEVLDLDRHIHNVLRDEQVRFESLKLVLPKEWSIIANRPAPLALELRHFPDEYQRHMSKPEPFKGVEYEDCKDKAESQGSDHRPRYANNGQQKTSSDSELDNTTQTRKQEILDRIANLCAKYPLPDNSLDEDQDDETTKVIAALQIEVKAQNDEWKKWFLTKNLIRALKDVPEYRDVANINRLLKKIKRDDARKHIGDASLNEEIFATHPSQFPQALVYDYMKYSGTEYVSSEGKVEKTVGALLSSVVVAKDLVEECNKELPSMRYLRALDSNPFPDIYVRPEEGTLTAWHPWLLPVLFAAEGKLGKRHTIHTKAQLACAFQSTMVILIILYLDTRHSSWSACPPWLFLYGIEYIEDGIRIHAHHPSYNFDKKRWELISSVVTDNFNTIFDREVLPPRRLQALAALFKIRSHSLFVLDQLKKWERGPKVLEVLQQFAKMR